MVKHGSLVALLVVVGAVGLDSCTSPPPLPPPILRSHPRSRPALEAGVEAGEHLSAEQQAWLEEHNPFGAPEYSMPVSNTLLVRECYALSHNNIDLVADWVAYHLSKAYAEGTEARPGDSAFKPDPDLPLGHRAERADYKGSGYDRGHQCPNADARGRGDSVVMESFLPSNMTPQQPSLNQQRWADLEERIRLWAIGRGEVWIVTGPAYPDDGVAPDKVKGDGVIDYSVLGDNEVAIPNAYYKIVVAKQANGDVEALAFLMPNKKLTRPDEGYLVSIDRIEDITRLDFFSGLQDSVENALESGVATSVW